VLELLRDPEAVLALGAWAYVLLALAVAVDSVLPLVPSEVLVVTAGAFVARGSLDVRVVVPAVIAGGVVGDLATYHLGRAGSRRVRRTMTSTPRRRQLFVRLQRSLGRRRTATVVAARFVPGGRTAVGLLAGVTRQSRRAYLAASLVGVGLWATYVLGLGYVTGRSADNAWVSIAAGVAVATLVSAVAAVRSRRAPSGIDPGPDVSVDNIDVAA
jgi:membrane-associated protein